VLAVGAGKAALLVPEELAFDELRRNRAAVQGQEWRLLAPAQVVDRLRGELLSGTALAAQQHGGRSRRHAAKLVVELLHRGGAAEDVAEAPEPAQLVAQLADLGPQLAGARHAPQDRLEPIHVDRLHHVVGGAEAERFHRAFDAGVTGDQHHLGGFARLQVGHQLDALAVGKLQVGDHDVRLQPGHMDARGAQRVCGCHGEAFGLGELAQPFERFGIVVYEQEVWHL
jgi:hypothetical protein